MESSSCFRQNMPRMRDGQWPPEHCVQKVEEMLSRAMVHQEDLLGLLTSNSLADKSNKHSYVSLAEATSDCGSISPPMLRALKAKIENSMDWCNLALCRLREIMLHTSNPCPSLSSRSAQQPMGASGHGLWSSYSKPHDAANQQLQSVSSSTRLNVPTPRSSLRVSLRTEPLSPHPFILQGHSNSQWNPVNLLFSDSAPHLPPPPGEDSSSQQHQQQGQNFARLPASLRMDTSDWPALLSEAGPVTPPLLPSAADPRQCSPSCLIHPVVGSFNGGEVADHMNFNGDDQSFISKTPTPLLRGNRSRNGAAKSEVSRKLSGGDAKLEVVFQKLNDAKKGIPDDGHRSWKKYGNKSIQNSNHCRGYYKCSVKECRAKKMVQPTDKDPTLFEVTYVGKHSCSSTGQQRRSSRSAAPVCNVNPAPVEAPEGPSAQGKRTATESTAMDTEGRRIPTVLNSVTDDPVRESNRWTSAVIPCKRGRDDAIAVDENANLDNFSYLHTLTTSTTTSASEEREQTQVGAAGEASMDTYLHQSSHHHQAVYSFQEPLLWHDFDMDTSLSTDHKPVSLGPDSP